MLNLLLKLSGGWRPRKQNAQAICGSSSAILRHYKVGLYVVCSIDIVKEMKYIQVLKIWDILPLEDIPKLTNRFIRMISSIIAMRHVLRGMLFGILGFFFFISMREFIVVVNAFFL